MLSPSFSTDRRRSSRPATQRRVGADQEAVRRDSGQRQVGDGEEGDESGVEAEERGNPGSHGAHR